MRRLAAISGATTVLAVLAVLALGGHASASSSGTVDVIFDDARGLIAGQLMKVAGAQAGMIEKVSLTSDFKARIEASIETRFLPFHEDATCVIRPEGLIAENYIDCDPGTPGTPALRSVDGFPPTVPVTHTTEPVGLADLFDIFDVPTSERVGVIINELGIGTAGEGQNFNDIIRRANPALQDARQAISVLSSEQSQLDTVLTATNTIAAQAAAHTGDLQSFLDRAASVTTLTADHQSSLAEAINRLPGLLAAAQPALAQLNTVAVEGTPLVGQIHAAVPGLNTLAEKLGPFVSVAKPALKRLGTALTRAVPAVRDAAPIVTIVRRYLKLSLPSVRQIATVFESLQQHGFVENFLGLVYYLSALTARYDSIGHLGVAYLIAPDNGLCTTYATTPVAACSANYGSAATYAASRTPRRRPAAAQQSPRPPSSGQISATRARSAPGAPPSATPSPKSRGTAPAPAASGAGSSPSGSGSGSGPGSGQILQSLLRYLLR